MSVWLAIYIAGGVTGLALLLVKTVGFYAYRWATHSHLVAKNLRKIDPPLEESLTAQATTWAIVLGVTFALSWLSVVVELLWVMPIALLRALREFFSSTPEAVKLLRFPLRNNPAMSAEAVFAHVTSLGQVAGEDVLTAPRLIERLDAVKKKVFAFDAGIAIDQLAALRVIDETILDAARRELRSPLRLKFFRGLKQGSDKEDEVEAIAYRKKREQLEKEFPAKAGSTEWSVRPAAYYEKAAALDWEYRGMLWRRNGYSIDTFSDDLGPADETLEPAT